MLFNTLEYIIFFFVVVVFYFLLSHKYRWILLLAASYYFYMNWKLEYIALIIASTLIDYFAAIQISKLKEKKQKIKYVYLSILANIGILFTFKYYNFFIDQVNQLFILAGSDKPFLYLDVLLPVGISFYTFQTLGYTIDVYNGKIEPQRHLGKFALFVSFFPQLVAGPIERAKNLLPQFDKKFSYDYDRIRYGLLQMTWGFFKKMVIADRLALFVDQYYSNPSAYTGMDAAIATIFFGIQMYCDFSGYSDIAIGTAKVMGFDLMENFKRPFFSRTVSEFWTRWHISLTTWFRDYVFIPLSRNKKIKWHMYYNLIIAFALSGLWHGAGFNFILFFVLHCIILIIGRETKDIRYRIYDNILKGRFTRTLHFFQALITFGIYIAFMPLFRSTSIENALITFAKGFDIFELQLTLANDIINFILSFVFLGLLLIIEFFQEKRDIFLSLTESRFFVRWLIYFLSVLIILYFGIFNYKEFIYFQF